MFVVKWIFNQNLRLEYCLKHFRKFITMFLRKINKSDYFVFKTYRFIALLNILNKIMKSIMTIRLSYVAKKHNLLLKKHFEDRKNIVSKHVLHYIVETINSIWVSKKIATMLLLNVIEAFDNVSHFRLLHNLKKRRIENIFLTWVKSFFSERYIILKLIDHIIDRIQTVIDVFQKFSMSSILYVFYNANLIDWCINSQIDIIDADFIDDIDILIMFIHWWKHEARSRADHVTEFLNPESDLIVDLSFSTSFRKSYHFQFTTIVLRACSLLVDWNPYHSRSKDESTLISLYSFSHRSEDENHSITKKQTFETSNFATKRSIDSAR
jgi:hypothetical protein